MTTIDYCEQDFLVTESHAVPSVFGGSLARRHILRLVSPPADHGERPERVHSTPAFHAISSCLIFSSGISLNGQLETVGLPGWPPASAALIPLRFGPVDADP